jgi:hypothetical protein
MTIPTKAVAGIRVQALLKRLQDHALGNVELGATQIRAIELLLRKSEAVAAAVAAKEDKEPAIVRIERKIVYPGTLDGGGVRPPAGAGEGQGCVGRAGEW